MAASPAAEHLLGYGSGELTGWPVTRLISHQYRQAHLAGLSMHNLSDRRNLFDHAVRVAILRADGTQLDVTLHLTDTITRGPASIVMADIHPVLTPA